MAQKRQGGKGKEPRIYMMYSRLHDGLFSERDGKISARGEKRKISRRKVKRE